MPWRSRILQSVFQRSGHREGVTDGVLSSCATPATRAPRAASFRTGPVGPWPRAGPQRLGQIWLAACRSAVRCATRSSSRTLRASISSWAWRRSGDVEITQYDQGALCFHERASGQQTQRRAPLEWRMDFPMSLTGSPCMARSSSARRCSGCTQIPKSVPERPWGRHRVEPECRKPGSIPVVGGKVIGIAAVTHGQGDCSNRRAKRASLAQGAAAAWHR